tara:strand:- start:200 stop:343 length:144 start_codon:yes stop_codon:yes gene_type:complete
MHPSTPNYIGAKYMPNSMPLPQGIRVAKCGIIFSNGSGNICNDEEIY